MTARWHTLVRCPVSFGRHPGWLALNGSRLQYARPGVAGSNVVPWEGPMRFIRITVDPDQMGGVRAFAA
jgi:hypothetical protein